ncbi:molybdate ABC transporter periplasmic binding protein [Alcanivorax nanhaiticus]|uniref:Molybdate ABC transporter periplasmic binding protein n=1 Tax=Alcanivorax nanhaiticus TaxID=1177154 RepID=A0A095TU32_9GAMM|nr:molybdate ABC transporter substrate-binding protein [Alcanivorax nanhaiticus]KGD65918.1 molybdate ABC transporter periplasmic binding protein [Alcanivorax nanhaiticus]
MRPLIGLLLLALSAWANADRIQIAVAANFAEPLREIVAQYRQLHPDIDIALTVASTGKLAAQIRHGAPYDLFLAADSRRPRELAREGLGLPDSVRSYARGLLVLWSPQSDLMLDPDMLRSGAIQPVALANPRTAPYGLAARFVLDDLAVPDSVPLVQAENVGQSYHFAHSGAAAAAFVAYSQVREQGGSLWLIPEARYPAIIQQAIQLIDSPEVSGFYQFLFSDEGRAIIINHGYQVTDAE